MCKGPVVGGGAAHKRTWQSSVAAVQRGKGAVRNEAESGRSPAVALLKKQPHKQVTHTAGEVCLMGHAQLQPGDKGAEVCLE